MTRPTLTVVGSEKPDTTAEEAEAIARVAARMAEAVKDPDGAYWALTMVGGALTVAYFGGQLESAVIAETVAGDMKREAVGL